MILWKQLVTGLTLLGVLQAPLVNGQTSFPVKRGALWGLANEQGKWLVEPAYEYISDWRPGQGALVRLSGKWGLLSEEGKVAIPCQYERLDFVRDGLLTFREGGLNGLADILGNVLAKATFEQITPLSPAIFQVRTQKKVGLLHSDGNLKIPTQFDRIEVSAQGCFLLVQQQRKGVANPQGVLLLPAEYEWVHIQGNEITAKKGMAITLLVCDAQYQVLQRKEFPNEVALKQAREAEAKKEMARKLAENPTLKVPRWTYADFRFTLVNGVGQNLLGNLSFYEVSTADKVPRSFAKEYLLPAKPGDKEREQAYLINHQEARVVAKLAVKDMMVTDFEVASVARATADTLWDALVQMNGEMIREAGGMPLTEVGDFSEGRAWVRSGKLFGAIDQAGKLVIPFEYEVLSSFEGGYAVARKGGKFGCIRPNGAVAIPFEYDGIDIPRDGLCRVKVGKGNAGKWGVINLQQQVVVPLQYTLVYPFHKGVARIRQGNLFGLVDQKGKILLVPSIQADEVLDFDKGLARVQMGRYVEETEMGPVIRYRKTGFVKMDGTYLLEPVYDRIDGFEACWNAGKGIARVVKNGKTGYVDHQGKIILPALYDQADRFEQIWASNSGLAAVVKNGKTGYVTPTGKEVLPAQYDWVDTAFVQVYQQGKGLAKCRKEGKFGLVNALAETVVPFEYEAITEASEDFIIARYKGKWGVLTTDQSELIPFQFDGIRPLKGAEGRFLEVSTLQVPYHWLGSDGTLKGTSPTRSELAVPTTPAPVKQAKYQYASDFDTQGFAVVQKGEEVALVDAGGRLLTKYKYLEIGPFADGLALVKLSDSDRAKRLYGYIDREGKEVIAPQYKQARAFSDGLAEVQSGAQWGYINPQGQWALKAQYAQTTPFVGGYALVNQQTVIDKQGKVQGTVLLEGSIKDGFQGGRGVWQTTTGQLHILPNGQPAYYAQYDAVTPFAAGLAFAKRGEQWELVRQTARGDVQLKFNHAQKLAYLRQYGERRSEKLPDGSVVRDKAWNLLAPGNWRMISPDGYFLSEGFFTEVEYLGSQGFVVKPERWNGIFDIEGKWVVTPKATAIQRVAPDIYKVEEVGKTSYLQLSSQSWLFGQQ